MQYGDTPLMVATKAKNKTVAKALLKAGANREIKDIVIWETV